MAITTTGTLTNKVSSTVSTPTVNYSATYTATRANELTEDVSVVVNFAGWLNSSSTAFGNQFRLMIYARINHGDWKSVVIKNLNEIWDDTSKHNVSVTFNINTKNTTANIDFYVAHAGSMYSGTAGTLGNAENPKSYTATLPAYKAVPDTPAADKYVYIKVNNAWKQAAPYVKVNGSWKQATAYVKTGGAWKST